MPEFKMICILFLACGLAAGSLSVVNRVTRDPIAGWEKKQRESALREVFPKADVFTEVTANRSWTALAQGRQVGRVVLTEVQGYSGPITFMVGVDAEDVITALKVLSHTETPGLGAKITTARFQDQFVGKRLQQVALKKDSPGTGQIDAITAATISSRAVARAVAATLGSLKKEDRGDRK